MVGGPLALRGGRAASSARSAARPGASPAPMRAASSSRLHGTNCGRRPGSRDQPVKAPCAPSTTSWSPAAVVTRKCCSATRKGMPWRAVRRPRRERRRAPGARAAAMVAPLASAPAQPWQRWFAAGTCAWRATPARLRRRRSMRGGASSAWPPLRLHYGATRSKPVAAPNPDASARPPRAASFWRPAPMHATLQSWSSGC
mmetsp:Transcript_109868/g.276418  ORF Transcript_109868/g.276418 Transcript_109868/m.276418 type:complete len:200 (-) Transcript_109868:507-1106(-)